MAKYYLHGKCRWAKVHDPVPAYDPTKPEEYSIDLTMDQPSWELFKQSGCQLQSVADKNRKKGKDVEDGDETTVTFRCPTEGMINGELKQFKLDVLDENNEPFQSKIGNGSEVTIKVDIFATKMGKGHRLTAVRVDELVPYEDGQVVNEIDSPF